jgi:hypothetical protein
MTLDEQSRARRTAIDFVQRNMASTAVAAVALEDRGRLSVVQDFTGDHAVLESSILRLSSGIGNRAALNPLSRSTTIEMTTKLLAILPDKKALIYFEGGISTPGESQAELQSAIQSAVQANVAVYRIDVSGRK